MDQVSDQKGSESNGLSSYFYDPCMYIEYALLLFMNL